MSYYGLFGREAEGPPSVSPSVVQCWLLPGRAVVGRPEEEEENPQRNTHSSQGVNKLLRESSDFCPPLKSAVGGVAHIISLVETMKGNKDDAVRLFKRADSLLDLLADLVTDSTSVPDPLFIAIVNLSRELQFSIVKADRVPKKHVVTRLFNTSKEKEQLRVLREQLDEAMERFKASAHESRLGDIMNLQA
ncbi:hypothetical protein DFH11DRAFT_1550571 [Phellopilus nigrolimitatus]|nr:hypothetical protein DFH11DRAFT_1550571 [Phellopilus nigrolimitatus]